MKTTHNFLFKNSKKMGTIPSSSVHLVVTSPPYPMIEMWDDAFARQNNAARTALAHSDGPAAFEAMHRVLDPVWGELWRVLKPGGLFCASVPRRWPEKICWALSEGYYQVPGGHIRIFRSRELRGEIEQLGFDHYHRHWAHALHAPFWWLKCLFWNNQDGNWLVRQYHRLLVWDRVPSTSDVAPDLVLVIDDVHLRGRDAVLGQPGDAVEVQVVGGLVEKEDVGRSQEHGSQGQAVALAPGENRHLLVDVVALEQKAPE